HICGKANVTADYLSRAPCISETDCEENEYDDDVLVACLFNSEELHSALTKQEWEEATRDDNVFTEMKKYIMEGWPREKRLNETLQPYWKIKDDITIVDEVLLRGETLIAPMSLKGRLVALAHEDHVRMTGTKQKLRERYWWPAMNRGVDIFVSQCSVCAKADKTMSAYRCPILSFELPEGPWIKIRIDFIGPMHVLPLNMRYAIVIIDYFSKWIEEKFVSQPTTSEVTTFMKEVFCKEGFPRQLVSDNVVQFLSQEMTMFLKVNDIEHIGSFLYHPQSNGQVEWANRLAKETIQMALRSHIPIEAALRTRLWSYRTTPHNTTGRTPCELLRGRVAITQLQPYWSVARKKWETKSLKEKEIEMRKLVDQRQKHMRSNFNARNAVKEMNVSAGDLVRVRYRKKGVNMSKYSEPRRVVKTKGTAVLLDNDQWWNGSNVVSVKLPEPGRDHEVVHNSLPEYSQPANHSEQCRTSHENAAKSNPSNMSSTTVVTSPKGTVTTKRAIVPPVRFKDYVLN
ncbi:hypothetical protein NDU88_001097, partial [Pleurodeles waltl]